MPNRLAGETSPYLRQHAGNPVDWHPWGEDALALARDTGRPILLSIGYSACHWCHVMARESFEDPDIAALMNRLYVNVKVDREERPDLDHIYQTAHNLLTGRAGGWPLTMFLTPGQEPFFGGTYFPRTGRYGLPGFGDVLERVARAYDENRTEIARQNEALRRALVSDEVAGQTQAVDPALVVRGAESLAAGFEPQFGGFGDAPKFPHPTELDFLLERHADTGDAELGHIVVHTLTQMARGGLFDQLGGGFYRYSTDRRWSIPHFEKMLYDNGLLLGLYADAWALAKSDVFRDVAAGTAQWLMAEMQCPEGGYCAALDADSEHEEGKFYVWTREEVRQALSSEEYEVFAPLYGLSGPANFESRSWHLRLADTLASVAKKADRDEQEVERLLRSARGKLLSVRARRVRPGLDDKILTGWNALAIAGMSRAGRVFQRPEWSASARRAFDFVQRCAWRDGRLYATCTGGQSRFDAYLDDHAFLLAALLELMQDSLREADVRFAQALAESLLDRFEDGDRGGFYFTGHDHETLIHRPKTGHDGAQPSGNGVAARALLRLGNLLGEPRYIESARRTVDAFGGPLQRHPGGCTSLLSALAELIEPPTTIILRGPEDATAQWKAALQSGYRSHTLVLDAAALEGLPQSLAKPLSGQASAYVCRGTECLPPVGDQARLEALIG
jgi:uncharacterized protein YyaL (SSP411 family)